MIFFVFHVDYIYTKHIDPMGLEIRREFFVFHVVCSDCLGFSRLGLLLLLQVVSLSRAQFV